MAKEIKKEYFEELYYSKSINEILNILDISIPTFYILKKECKINGRKKGSGRTKIKLI